MRRRGVRRTRHGVFAHAAAHAAALAAILAGPYPAMAGDDESERALLQKSWSQACEPYRRVKNWSALEACNLSWFRAHEKAVWHLNLNPHGAAAASPSS